MLAYGHVIPVFLARSGGVGGDYAVVFGVDHHGDACGAENRLKRLRGVYGHVSRR